MHVTRRAWLLLALVILAPAPVRGADDPLATKLRTIIDRPDYKGARWGILVVDAATGKTVFEHNAEQLFAPASVTKLYS